jgi:Family of unknown function (DUF6314)
MGPVALPTDLLGTWTLTRVVDDHLTGERRDVVGTATLELESPGRVRWSEEGTMTWAGRSVPVSRTLYVERAGATWSVTFSDGRPFHPWSVGTRVGHPCGADHYEGLVEVGPQGWTVEWRARGPEKDYLMRTVHTERRDDHHLSR